MVSSLQYSIIPLFYQVALDELRDDRDHHELDVPILAKSIREVNHILSRKSEPDWKSINL